MKKIAVLGLLAVLSLTACNGAGGKQEQGTSAAETAPLESGAGQNAQQPAETQSAGAAEETAAAATEETTENEKEPAYHVETKEKTWSTEDGIAAATVKLEYPVLEGDSEAYLKINEYFKKWAEDGLKEYDEDNTEESFVKASLDFRSNYAGDELPAWESTVTVNSVTRYKELLGVYQDSYTYEGGAHGMPGRNNHLFNAQTGEEVKLAGQIGITPEELNVLVKDKFMKLVENDTEGRFFEEAAQTLETKEDFIDNYYLAEDGVVFYSEPYEIAPYAAGYSEVTVPYEELGM